jgi:predicted lipoprotein
MKRGAAIPVLACALLACRAPWTVRPIDAEESASSAGRPFDAARYAASIWEGKVVPAAAHAPDFAEARRAGRCALVKGTGRVLRVDSSRQRILLDIHPYDGKPDAELAAGQIRGTALRDALPFIQFSQFVNQVDFARASNALNDRAAAVAAAALAGVAAGSVLSFAGALNVSGGNGLPEIVPVILSQEPERP